MRTGRLYDEREGDGPRVLVDRLWPRGVRRDDPRIDVWLPQVAPSHELRRWYGHQEGLHDEFVRRYTAELDTPAGRAALDELRAVVAHRPGATLITAARDVELGHVPVLTGLVEPSQ